MTDIAVDLGVRPIISTDLSKNKQKQSKSKFSREDDIKLISLVMSRNDRDWVWISQQMPNRNPRQCRERWYNYLDPSLHKGGWSKEEDQLLLEKKKEMGPHWNAIARFFSGRSGNSVRNRWLLIMRHEEKNNTDNTQEPIEIKIPPIVPADLQKEIFEKKYTKSDEMKIDESDISDKFDDLLMPKEKLDLFSHSGTDQELFYLLS